jgi:phosphoglycerate dehydrogenase-like enzyme
MERADQDRPTTVLVVGASADDPPPGMPEQRTGARYVFAATAEELERHLPEADVLFAWDFRTTLLRAAWPHARRLRWMDVAGIGADGILFPELVDSEVILTNARGVYDRTIAEYAVGLILLFAKDFARTLASQHERRWDYRQTEPIHGKQVLVVGAGTIGLAIARNAKAMGMEVTLVARRRRQEPDLGPVHPVEELHDLLPQADYVVLITPLTAETRGLIDRAAFARMKPTARLINLARGAVVDEAALLEALRSGQIAGAALDVFWQEPFDTSHPLWEMPNVIISPHMSGDVHGFWSWFADSFLANLERWQSGQPLRNVVDKRLGYVPS